MEATRGDLEAEDEGQGDRADDGGGDEECLRVDGGASSVGCRGDDAGPGRRSGGCE